MQAKVTICPIAYAKIMFWVRHAKDYEVSGFGKVERNGHTLHVRDVFLLQQRNTMGSTVLDAEDIGRVMFQRKDEPGDLNFWWHSHNTMAAFWSSTDYDTIRDLGGEGWLLATVFNDRAQTQTALYTTKPVPYITEGLQLQIADPVLPQSMQAELIEQYTAKVTEVSHAQSKHQQQWGKAKAQPHGSPWGSRKDRRRWKRYLASLGAKADLLLDDEEEEALLLSEALALEDADYADQEVIEAGALDNKEFEGFTTEERETLFAEILEEQQRDMRALPGYS